MKSRYDYMWEGNSRDEVDNEFYPDPLSIDYDSALEGNPKLPEAVEVNYSDIKRLWVFFYKNFGKTETDDIIYQLNDIPHVGMLEPGDAIYKFDISKLRSYKFFNLKDN